VAHDINSEVGHIRNRAYWLSEEPCLSDAGKHYAGEIDSSARLLAGTLASVRAEQQAEAERFVLEDLLKQKVDAWLRDRAPGVGVSYELACPGEAVRVHQEQLWRVIRHLIRNAVEAMKNTGIVMIRTHCASPGWAEVQVEDSRPGIPAELQAVILREPVSSKSPDRGFGLILARSLIEGMGGSICLLPSQPGQGAVFSVRLPLADGSEEEVDHVVD